MIWTSHHVNEICARALLEVLKILIDASYTVLTSLGSTSGLEPAVYIIKMKRNRSLNTTNGLLAKMESSYVTTCFGLDLWTSSGYNLV